MWMSSSHAPRKGCAVVYLKKEITNGEKHSGKAEKVFPRERLLKTMATKTTSNGWRVFSDG